LPAANGVRRHENAAYRETILRPGIIWEVAKVGSRDAVAEFQGGHPDQQIGERKADALRLVLAVDLAGA
jgi:hypothetical protein